MMFASIQHAWQQARQRPHRGVTRESRDTLWLLLMLALVIAPHAPHLPWWSSLGASMALLWRARAAWRQSTLPSRSWLVFLLLVLLSLTWLTYGTLIGRQAGITLVVMLATLKSLELKARRDALVCMYLGFFLVFTQFLFSQGIGTAVMMMLAVWGLLCALMLGQRPLGYPRMRDIGAEALRAMLWGIPLMITLFVLFPRIGPLWSLPSNATARTGLSDSLSLGEVATLAQDNTIALRIQFLGAIPPAKDLYFRGPTLEQFDGQKWVAETQAHDERSSFSGTPYPYLMTVEPYALHAVPLLEGTREAQVVQPVSSNGLVRYGVQWWRNQKTEQRLQIRAMAHAQISHGPLKADASLLRWLYLPRNANPRTRQWAVAWAQQQMADIPSAQARTPHGWIQALLRHIRTEHYRYTLSPGESSASPHTIDHFWLDSQAGFCEHFASSFVMIMRVLGMPARIVTGYQGAERNPIDGLYVVRNSHAHAWVEVWVENEGWIRVDPTAAVAPERVEHSPPMRPFAGLPGPFSDLDPQALHRLRTSWEAIDHRWNQWVLQYSNEEQMNLLRAWGWASPDGQALGQLLATAMAALAVGSALLLKLRGSGKQTNRWSRAIARMDRALLPLGPSIRHNTPWPASVWREQLLRQWMSGGTTHSNHAIASLNTCQRALLESLLDLDAARYGTEHSGSAHRLPAQVAVLLRQIEQLSRDCQISATTATS